MTSKTKIIIIGGGFAGVFTAKNILKQFNKAQLSSINIELISDKNYFVFQPLLPEVSSAIINPHDAVTPLRLLLPNIKHRLATVKRINPKDKQLEVLQGRHKKDIRINYDELIIACGQTSNLTLSGFASHTWTLKDIGDAFALRNQVLKCLELADVTEDKALKAQVLTFVIIGAGFSGVEVAGELQDMVKKVLKFYPNITLSEVKFIILQKEERILTQLTPKLAAYAHKKLQKRAIDIRLNIGVAKATKTHVELDNKHKIYTHTIITTIGSVALDFISQTFNLTNNRIIVNEFMQVKQFKHIWALGDAALIPLNANKSNSEYAPPTAQFAVREAKILAKNLRAKLFDGTMLVFNFNPLGLMASLGNYQGVIEIRGWVQSGVLAWAMWRGIYMVKLPGFTTKLRVFLNWMMDYFFPRTLVQIAPISEQLVRYDYYAKGEVIYDKNELINCFSLVISGKVQIGKSTFSAQNNLVSNTQQVQYEDDVIALEDTIVMTLPWQDFLRLRTDFKRFDSVIDNTK